MPIELENLRSWEKVDSVVRRHWIVFALIGIYAIGWIILTVAIFVLMWSSAFTLLMIVVFWMFYSLFLYISWLDYELDLFVITNNRVIAVEQKGFLNRAVGECTLDKIQEVGIETKWLFANIFDYGTVTLKTAGSTSNFDMTFSPKPMESSRYINNIVDRYRDDHSFKSQKGVSSDDV